MRTWYTEEVVVTRKKVNLREKLQADLYGIRKVAEDDEVAIDLYQSVPGQKGNIFRFATISGDSDRINDAFSSILVGEGTGAVTRRMIDAIVSLEDLIY